MELYLISIGQKTGAMMNYPTILIGPKGLDLDELKELYGFDYDADVKEEVAKFIQWLKEKKGMFEPTYEFIHFEEPK